jgi:hypothetical protein
VADPARGTLMGNRGCLHDAAGTIRRFHSGKRWIFCRLEFKNRRRELMQPGRYTELFFLDEATAFAAGHRPCAECMRKRFREFRERWAGGSAVSATAIDQGLHAERIGPRRSKVTYRALRGELPDGAFVVPVSGNGMDSGARLLWEGAVWRWTFAGYGQPEPLDPDAEVDVLTPRSIVGAFAAGFRPVVAARC